MNSTLSLQEQAADTGPDEATDVELVDVIVETFGMTHDEALTRLAGLDFDALRQVLP